jgi:hypothetical protein
VKTAGIDLFHSILGMDALAWAATRAAEPPGEPFADLECVLSKTSSELVLQLLSTMPSESRFLALRHSLFEAMEIWGPLAYSKAGNATFKNGFNQADLTVPQLEPYARIEGHHPPSEFNFMPRTNAPSFPTKFKQEDIEPSIAGFVRRSGPEC